MHIYILGPKLLRWNFLQISQLSIRSGAHKLFHGFLDFSQFWTAISQKNFGPHSHHLVQIEVKICTAKQTQVPVIYAMFDVNQCGAKNLIFGLWVNLIPAVCCIAAVLPVKSLQWRVRSTLRISHNCHCKNKEGDITLHHIDIMTMWCRIVSPSFYFCSFSCVIYV